MEMLKKLRERIDWLDTQIASLLNERMRAADQVGKIKKDNKLIIKDSSREKQVLDQVEMMVQHPILKANIANIYGAIMQESRVAQQLYQHSSLPFRRIGIVGLGLMGGSICKALKMKDPSIEIGSLHHPSQDYALAREGEWIDHEYATVADLVKNSELIILATPISVIPPLAEEIKRHCRDIENLTVIDLASVKGEIVALFETLSDDRVEYISTHPMSGKEKSGFANSQATLYVGHPWVIVPHEKNSASRLDAVKELIRYLGSEPICLDACTHDQQAALISHIPSILSKSYFDFVCKMAPESTKMEGPGFRSFTRLAHDNPEMRSEIAQKNGNTIKSYLKQWLEQILKMESLTN